MNSRLKSFSKADPERAREAGRRGGVARALQLKALRAPAEPLGGTIVDLGQTLGVFQGPSWAGWWAFLKALFAIPLEPAELEVFRAHTGRETAPVERATEGWVIVGRRGGKSRVAALIGVFLAACRDYRAILSPGERGVVMLLAADRAQARVILHYVKALFSHARLAPLVTRRLRDAVELKTNVVVQVYAASHKTSRGYTLVGAVLDEIAFWPTDEGSAEPDAEVVAALRPGMATVPGALLVGVSTPYAQRGVLFKTYERHYGRADSDILVWRAPSLAMNPTIPERVVVRATEDDAVAAAAEYEAEFRRDVQSLLDVEAVRAVVVGGRRELPPVAGVTYTAFADPSGGSQDSFTLGIAHAAGEQVVLDVVREVRPPFSPEDVVAEFAAVLATYRISEVVGDRYGGQFPQELFRKHGITYNPSERSKSDLYKELVPLVNGARVELLDVPRLLAQIVGLERRVARGGKDSIDHGPGGAHDDLSNAAAGALVNALKDRGGDLVFVGGQVMNLFTGEVVE